ncbi:MAG: NfeD family protein [Planctomycetota bacterium]|nr:MAG: NfeD family protein [Planctomycetota bacterium]
MFELMDWHLWLISGMVLAIAEMLMPGFWILCFSFGAFAGGLTGYLGYDLASQIGVFSGVSALLVIFIRPLALKFFHKSSPEIETNINALIGQMGLVVREIKGRLETGKVKVGGEIWSAISQIDLPIPEGKQVVIKKIEGNKVIVEPVKEE